MNCSACSTNHLTPPAFPDLEVLALTATPVTGYPVTEREVSNHGVFSAGEVNFCNVTVTYTHPGQDDLINVEVWLPPKDVWNERIIAVGGGGWAMGRFMESFWHMAGVVSEDYATFTTDAGLADPFNPASWALSEPGVLDEVNLANWGSVHLKDMSRIGKQVVESFYRAPAEYSYYVGCSQGGRQGWELAQSFPDAFDGIAAAAPAPRLGEIFMSWYWPQILMNLAGEWPRGCEIDSLTALAVAACDGTDGVEDGILSDPSACDPFNPFDFVDSPAEACLEPSSGISEIAAYIANATWSGIWDEQGKPVFFAQHRGTDLTGITTGGGIATTTCQDSGQECAGAPLSLGPVWIQVFGYKDPDFDYESLTLEQFYSVLRDSIDEYAQYVGTYNPDLEQFRDLGGKMITFHGLADQTIPAGLSRNYYEEVAALDSGVSDYFRYFEAPGLTHCIGNGHPTTAFAALRDWVENGVAPDSLPVTVRDASGGLNSRIVCPHPQVARFNAECGDSSTAECFTCE